MINELVFFAHTGILFCITFIFLYFGESWLMALLCSYGIMANLFITKQITLFGFHVTTTDVFAVGITLCLNLLQEFFGIVQARRALIINFFISLVFLAASMLQLAYTPNVFDVMHPHFTALLHPMPRIIIASLVSYLLVQSFDIFCYQKLYTKLHGSCFLGRSTGMLFVTQFFDTIVFSFLGLYGIVASVGHIIFVSFIIKLILILTGTPILYIASLCIKKTKFYE